MADINIRATLGSLKRGEEVSLNGFTIKKVGVNWIVRKGDFFKKSYSEQELSALVEKLEGDAIEKVSRKVKKGYKKAKKLAAKLASKAKKETKKTAKANKKAKQAQEKRSKKQDNLQTKQANSRKKQGAKVARKAAKKEARANKPYKRNKILLEIFNVLIQAIAYGTWYLYFFENDLLTSYLGEVTLYASVSVGALALITHLLYSLQLGKRHNISNLISGFVMIGLVVAGLMFLYSGIDFSAGLPEINEVYTSAKEVFTDLQNYVLVSFMGVKWVLLFFSSSK